MAKAPSTTAVYNDSYIYWKLDANRYATWVTPGHNIKEFVSTVQCPCTEDFAGTMFIVVAAGDKRK